MESPVAKIETTSEEDKNKVNDKDVMVVQINLFTNIPEGDHTIQNKEFKRNMIVLDKETDNKINQSETSSYIGFNSNSNLSNYPFISSKYKLKSSIIYKNYDYIYKFFFSYNTFVKKLENYARLSAETSNEIIYHNIDVLLRALFPLFLKTSEGYYNSFEYIENRNKLSDEFDLNNIVETLKKTVNISRQKYTVLNIGKEYTVKKIVWLNDFMNNPNYNNFMVSYRKFKNWINDYAVNDSANYDLIRTKTFVTNRNEFEKNRLKIGIRNFGDKVTTTPNPFFMQEIKDNTGKLNENYLNYAQFYDIIQYYIDNKTINEDLQNVIDGVFKPAKSIKKVEDSTVELKQVEKFYDNMDEIIENNMDDKFKKIIAFDTRKIVEQNKKFLKIIKIDVMMDFIEGKINNENYSTIQCPYMSNDLSNFILNKFYYKNNNDDYNFLKNSKYIYSITNKEIKTIQTKEKKILPNIKKNENDDNNYDNKDMDNKRLNGGIYQRRKTRNKKFHKKRNTKKNI